VVLVVTFPFFVTYVESGTSTNTLYAHAETTTVGGVSYYLHKLGSADGSAITLNASAASTGRKLMGRWVYSLSGIVSIPASTWSVTYRAMRSAQASSVVAHGDINILIRKSDNTIRTTIATNVANSPCITLTNAWETLTGIYSWSGYTVVDQTDYLEVAYYIEVTTSQSSKYVRLRVDDGALPLSDQTKIENVMFTYPATIWTDKADYEYYETVTVFGSGFEALANVTVTIVRPDATSDTVYAVTDDVGNFTCTYQLNGIAGTYTVTATDGTNTATTTFREGAITPELWGYTLEPSPGWTHGDVKGYYECQWVPYKIEVTNTKKYSYQLTVVVHHDYNDSTWLGLDDVRNWTMWRNGAPVPPPTISGLVKDGWESGIQQLQWNWTFTINEDDICTLMFEVHVAIGAHNYPGSKVHTHIHDITSVPCTPISSGHRDVPIVVEGPLLCSVTFYTKPSTVGNISFQGGTYTNGQVENFTYGTSGPATANAPAGWEFDHWEAMGNVQVSSPTDNPTTFTITCGGNLTAVFEQIQCLVEFYTDSSDIGNITFMGVTYTHGQSDTFAYGTSGPATANAPPCWEFDHWETTGNVGVSNTSANPTTVTITCGGTLKAVFNQIEYTLTITTTPGGTTNPAPGSYQHPCSSSVQVTAINDPCYEFDHWELDGSPVGSANPYTVHMDSDHALHAVFTQITYTLTITTTPGGTTSPSPGAHTYPCSTNVPVTAIPDPCYLFDHWELDTVDVGSANPYTVHMDSDHTLHAVFVQIEYTLTVNVVGSGSVTKNPDQLTYPCGTQVTLTAIPDPCWTFSHWSGDLTGSTTPDTITMDSDKTVTAHFTKINYTLTITSTSGGTTSPVPGAYQHPCSSNVQVTAIPDPCYRFDHWELDSVDVGSVNPYTVHMDANHTLHAVFTKINYTLTITTTTGGTTSPSPGVHVFPCSTNVSVIAIPDTCYRFDHWELDGYPAGSANPITVHMDADHTLHAVFTHIMCTVTFLTDPDTVGTISFKGGTYSHGQSDTFPCDTSGPATANPPTGWMFDHWVATGNVTVSDSNANPTTVTVTCGGTLKAFFERVTCSVTFYTDPSTAGSISFGGKTYTNGQVDTFPYGTSGPATANVPAGWVFDRWEATGNVQVSSTTTNPTTVTITCGGTLKAFFKRVTCTVTFYTDPSTVGSISFQGGTYTNGQSGTFTYGTSGPAIANAPVGWVFDHWETVGNVQVSSTTANPTTVTITCGGTLKAVFRKAPSPPAVGGEMILFKVDKPSIQGQSQVGLMALLLAATTASVILIRRKKRRQ